jgi:hypothetical protein
MAMPMPLTQIQVGGVAFHSSSMTNGKWKMTKGK